MSKRSFPDDSKSFGDETYLNEPPWKQVKLSPPETFHDGDDNQSVVIILDDNLSSDYLRTKLQCTSFLIALLSDKQFKKLFELCGQDVIIDYTITKAIRRITGQFFVSPHIKRLVQEKKFNQIPLEMKSRIEILKSLVKFGEIEKEAPFDIQNNEVFVTNLLRNNGRQVELPKLQLTTVFKIIKSYPFCYSKLPNRFQENPKVYLKFLEEYEGCLIPQFKGKMTKQIALEIAKKGGSIIGEFEQDVDVLFESIKRSGSIGLLMPNRNNKELFLKVLEIHPTWLDYASKQVLKEKEIGLVIAKNHPISFTLLSEELRDDHDIILEVIKKDVTRLKYCHSSIRGDKSFVLKAIENNIGVLNYISEELKRDREVVLKAVQHNGQFIKQTMEEFRNDREIALLAVKNNMNAYYYLSTHLQQDKEIALQFLKHGPDIFPIHPSLRSDTEIITQAVMTNGLFLTYASNELKNDKEIVLKAVKNNGLAFQYASMELQYDREVIFESISKNFEAITFMNIELLHKDKELALMAVGWGRNIMYLSEEQRDDEEIVRKAISKDGFSILFASNRLRGNKDLLFEACVQNCRLSTYRGVETLLHYVPDSFKSDPEIMLKLMEINPIVVLECTPSVLREDCDFMLKAMKVNSSSFKYATKLYSSVNFAKGLVEMDRIHLFDIENRVLFEDKNLAIEWIKKDQRVKLKNLPDNLKQDPEILVLFLGRESIPVEIVTDKHFLIESIKLRFKSFYEKATESLQNDRDVVLEFIRSVIEIPKGIVNFTNDKTVILTALRKLLVPDSISEALLSDLQILETVLELAKDKIPAHILNNKQIMSNIVKRKKASLKRLKLRNDREFVLGLCSNDYVCNYISEQLQQDADFMCKAACEF